MAHYHILQEVRTFEPGDWQLCFQYGVYEYDPDVVGARSKMEFGYRFIWRRPNGQLQGARGQARLEPDLMTILFGKAAAEGWYPTPPNPSVRNVTIGNTSWRVSVQTPVAVHAVADGDYQPRSEQGGLRFVSDSTRSFLPLGEGELPSDIEFALASREQFQAWLTRARGNAVAHVEA